MDLEAGLAHTAPVRRVLPWLPLAAAASLGLVAGLGAFTAQYAEATAYLSDDPAACNNCHIMNEQYDAWNRSSHREVAVCNDCHMPHDFFGKWTTKARAGLGHSIAFTTGRFHEPIRIHAVDLAIVEQACRDCHGSIASSIGDPDEPIACTRCHGDVGHMH